MRSVKRTLALFRRYVSISLRTESEFKADFWTSVAQLLLNSFLVIAFWDALFRLTGTIQGWTMGDLVMMSAVGDLSWVVGMLLPGLSEMPDRVLKGDMDRYLTKPAPPLLCLSWEKLSVTRIFHHVVSGTLVAMVAVFHFGYHLSWKGLLPGLLLVCLGRGVLLMFNASIGMLSFWVGKTGNLQAILNEVGRFARYPVTFFDAPMRVLLTWVWPYGLYLTYPVLLLRGDVTGVWLLLGGAGALLSVWVLLVHLAFRAGLRRYESFGG